MINIQALMKARQAKDKFMAGHPRLQPFINSIQAKGFTAGQEIAVAVRYPDGTEMKTGIRVTEADLELLNMLKELK